MAAQRNNNPGPDEVERIVSALATTDEHPNRWNLALDFGTCAQPGCAERNGLLKCGGCRAVLYCGAEHQRAHRPQHKTQCRPIKEYAEKLTRAEAALRASGVGVGGGGGGGLPRGGDPFETAPPAGQFWRFPRLQPYMTTRLDLVLAALDVRTGEAAQLALEHALAMLHLNRGDNQGVRDYVPALYLRLGRDQEAYDFLKWNLTTGKSARYDWGNTNNPFLDLHGEDAFEPCEALADRTMQLAFLVMLTHLKIRLYLDVSMLQQNVERHGGGSSSPSYEKKMEWVREDATTDILHKRRDIVERAGAGDYADLAADLRGQVAGLFDAVKRLNRHYWPALLEHPERYSRAQPMGYSLGSPQQVVLVFRQTWYAWAECPPAMGLAKKLLRERP
ncbi:hypothetical protein GGR56DRAFT_687313 [Xylariaceae sp. FL0804]|nr:hypothetical protein GGR56DRAFT_687313 [Xylariaceae sp. FL0804]